MVLAQAIAAHGGAPGANVLYAYLLDAIERKYDGDLEQGALEDQMRWFFGNFVSGPVRSEARADDVARRSMPIQSTRRSRCLSNWYADSAPAVMTGADRADIASGSVDPRRQQVPDAVGAIAEGARAADAHEPGHHPLPAARTGERKHCERRRSGVPIAMGWCQPRTVAPKQPLIAHPI
jgi:hypothetical protein